ncbi:MAG: hypothetical protein ACE5FT_05855 [Candidatus Nanoarchaeia archaeon]
MAQFKMCKVTQKGKREIFEDVLVYGKKNIRLYMLFTPQCEKDYDKTYKAFLKKNKGTKPDYVNENIPCIVFYFFTETMRQIMEPYTHFIDKELGISVTPNIVKDHAETMAYYPGLSTKKRVVLSFEWYHIIETIVHPYFKTGKIDHKYLAETMLHEFVGHYGDKLRGLDASQAKVEKKIDRIRDFRVRILNTMLFDLRAEGLARFYELKHIEKTRIHCRWIRKFRKNLHILLRKRTENSMQNFYEKKMYIEEGMYHAGMVMCITIALAIEKERGEDKLRRMGWLPMKLWWCSFPAIHSIPGPLFKATLDKIRTFVLPIQFIREYSEACKKLGIPESKQVFSEKTFYMLVDEITGTTNKMAKACARCKSFVDHYIHRVKNKRK